MTLRTQDGMSLHALSEIGPVLVLLPRGTAWFEDLSRRREELEGAGLRIVLVLAASDEQAAAALEPHPALRYLARIADPEGRLRAHFGLGESRRGLLGRTRAPLPGAFRLEKGEIVRAWRAARPTDRPPYGTLSS